METIIIIIIAITILLLIGVSLKANKAKKNGVNSVSPGEVAKEKKTDNTPENEDRQP